VTEHRTVLTGGGSIEVVKTPGVLDVIILADGHGEHVIVDLTKREAEQIAKLLTNEEGR